MAINLNLIQVQIQSQLGKELSDKEYVSIKKEQLNQLLDYVDLDTAKNIPITYGVSLYKITSDHYLLVDAEYHHNILIKDIKGDIWKFIKTKFALLNREVKEALKKHNITIEVELYPAENWYSYIYPNTSAIWNSNGVTDRYYDGFYFYGKHFDVIITKYSNNALWVKIYSPSLMLQLVKEFIYDNYKEK